VQKLTGRITSLNQFMTKIAEQSLPFFKALSGSGTFEWGPKQQEAFNALKEYIQKLPTLASPQPDRPLILYILATHTAVSGALLQEREILKEDRVIASSPNIFHFQSSGRLKEVLLGDGKYMLVMSARKLWHYFEVHKVRVLTNQLLNDIFGNHDSSARVGK
jgi:hypothetical protein